MSQQDDKSMPSQTSDIEEEEILFYADFDTISDSGIFKQDSQFKMIALDSDEPFLQIGAQMYSGKWLDSVGTLLFFEPGPSAPPFDPVFSDVPKSTLNYKYKTRKYLELSRVFVNDKNEQQDKSEHPSVKVLGNTSKKDQNVPVSSSNDSECTDNNLRLESESSDSKT